ncbi:LysM peptidoglycan-binding domain-containing protein [Nocardioides cavernaquae]|uniref:LysM domain-containing protein n=1 Tax=Nocardioides cavernaquae TaxID=2321396 RepID=A0A3A5H9D7_9ACTN|nr:LysM domain-containing protein [Nocardioides cavernaquae]RJS47249.1 LysM domain-containing protein [Nocardioides cavernaquae]
MGLWDKIKDGLTTDKGEVAEDAQSQADNAAAKAKEAQDKADAAKKDAGQPDAPAAPAPPAPEAPEAPQARPADEHKPKRKPHREYTVVSGDTLSEIGARFGVDWHDIARINDIPNPDLIYPGQVFKIPNK